MFASVHTPGPTTGRGRSMSPARRARGAMTEGRPKLGEGKVGGEFLFLREGRAPRQHLLPCVQGSASSLSQHRAHASFLPSRGQAHLRVARQAGRHARPRAPRLPRRQGPHEPVAHALAPAERRRGARLQLRLGQGCATLAVEAVAAVRRQPRQGGQGQGALRLAAQGSAAAADAGALASGRHELRHAALRRRRACAAGVCAACCRAQDARGAARPRRRRTFPHGRTHGPGGGGQCRRAGVRGARGGGADARRRVGRVARDRVHGAQRLGQE